jgi:hypothetical protein
MPLITIAASSTPTDMTMYSLDVDSAYDPLHSYFIRYAEATWDAISIASPFSISNLHVCVLAWITTPSKLLRYLFEHFLPRYLTSTTWMVGVDLVLIQRLGHQNISSW